MCAASEEIKERILRESIAGRSMHVKVHKVLKFQDAFGRRWSAISDGDLASHSQ